MATAAKRRLMRDFKRLQDDPPAGVSGAPTENNILQWNAVIFGPNDTPFEDGTFRLSLAFNEEYPNKPPIVKFLSKMFHPNIYAGKWSIGYMRVEHLLSTISSLTPSFHY